MCPYPYRTLRYFVPYLPCLHLHRRHLWLWTTTLLNFLPKLFSSIMTQPMRFSLCTCSRTSLRYDSSISTPRIVVVQLHDDESGDRWIERTCADDCQLHRDYDIASIRPLITPGQSTACVLSTRRADLEADTSRSHAARMANPRHRLRELSRSSI